MFTGYAPIHNPRFSVTVLVEHGGGGAKTAAPLAKEILHAAQTLIPESTPPGVTLGGTIA